MNYISFTDTLFCVCSYSGMSRCSLASTLSWVSLRQSEIKKCFYFPTEIVKARWQKLYPAHERRGKDGPTKWCRWMATILRRVNASDFPSSGTRCAERLQLVSSAKDTMLFEIGKTRFSSNIEFSLSSVKTNPTFWIQSSKPVLLFYSFFTLFPFFGPKTNDSNNPLCPRRAVALMARRQNVCAN